MTDLDALIRDIEAATGPDRALDERIALALGWTPDDTGLWKSPGGAWYYPPPPFTGSHDAARRTFGDVQWGLHRGKDGRPICIMAHSVMVRSATEPLAMCAASMRLKEREG